MIKAVRTAVMRRRISGRLNVSVMGSPPCAGAVCGSESCKGCALRFRFLDAHVLVCQKGSRACSSTQVFLSFVLLVISQRRIHTRHGFQDLVRLLCCRGTSLVVLLQRLSVE